MTTSDQTSPHHDHATTQSVRRCATSAIAASSSPDTIAPAIMLSVPPTHSTAVRLSLTQGRPPAHAALPATPPGKDDLAARAPRAGGRGPGGAAGGPQPSAPLLATHGGKADLAAGARRQVTPEAYVDGVG